VPSYEFVELSEALPAFPEVELTYEIACTWPGSYEVVPLEFSGIL